MPTVPFAERALVIEGGETLFTVTVTVPDVPKLPAASYALALRVWEPFVVAVVFQLQV